MNKRTLHNVGLVMATLILTIGVLSQLFFAV